MKQKFTWVWLVFTLLLSAVIIWASLKFAKYDQAIHYIDSKEQRTIVEKQPIYVQGLPGLKGDPGKDSVSTNTIIQRDTTIVQQESIQGEKGVPGNDGKTLELAYDADGSLLYRFVGDRFWQHVQSLGGDDE